jgi:hypothetical protein
MSPLVAAHGDWEALLAALAARPRWAALARLPAASARAALAAPVALAFWIAHRAPELAARARLRLLVIGAEALDAADEGRWYALLPELLDARFAVEATLVGAALDPEAASAGAALAPPAPARRRPGRLADFLREADRAAFDLAVVFHPGLQVHREWLEDGSLAQLLSAGVPLLASSYETDEFEMDRWVLECYGFAVAGDALVNPFFLELGEPEAPARWGRALWRFAERVPAAGTPPDRARLAALDLLTEMVMDSMLEEAAAAPAPGERVQLHASTGARRELIHVFDRHFADPETHRLWYLAPDGEMRAAGELPASDFEAWPGPGAREIERAVWAARIKAERLLARRSPRAGGEQRVERAARMRASLRARALAMLGGEG